MDREWLLESRFEERGPDRWGVPIRHLNMTPVDLFVALSNLPWGIQKRLKGAKLSWGRKYRRGGQPWAEIVHESGSTDRLASQVDRRRGHY